jgi:hypothetical protein
VKIHELHEAIKGWKHAHRDLVKMRSDRAAAQHTAKLVSVKKDGTESKMHDATKTFPTEAEARSYHEKIVKLNPDRNIRHNLYVDGKLMHMLDVNSLTEDASPGATSSGNVASLAIPLGTIQRRPSMFDLAPSGKTIRKKRKS